MKTRGPDRRVEYIPWKRRRETDLRTGERVYEERRKGEAWEGTVSEKQEGRTIYVDISRKVKKGERTDGLSWETAFVRVLDAVAEMGDQDTVRYEPGRAK